MDIKTLCLGVLTQGEASGYDIKKHFECVFSHFYVAGFGSIYPALTELARAADRGFIVDTVPQWALWRSEDFGKSAEGWSTDAVSHCSGMTSPVISSNRSRRCSRSRKAYVNDVPKTPRSVPKAPRNMK